MSRWVGIPENGAGLFSVIIFSVFLSFDTFIFTDSLPGEHG